MPISEFLEPVITRTGHTLLHFIWQAGVIAFLVDLAARRMPGRPHQRYIVYCAGFAVMVAFPLVTFAIVDIPSGPVLISDSASAVAAPSSGADPIRAPAERALGFLEGAFPAIEKAPSILARSLPWVVLIWIIGVGRGGVRLRRSYAYICQLSQNLQPPPDNLLEYASNLGRQFRLPSTWRMYVSLKIEQPMCLGWRRPRVLLPMWILTDSLPEKEIQGAIAHELDHIRRYDLWVNLAQRVAETLWFYHPAVLWLSVRMHEDRQKCCDVTAIAATGDRLAYACLLERVYDNKLNDRRASILYVVLSEAGMPTHDRVENVLYQKEAPPPRLPLWMPAVIPLGLVIALTTAAFVPPQRHVDPGAAFAGPAVSAETAPELLLAEPGPSTQSGIPQKTDKESDDVIRAIAEASPLTDPGESIPRPTQHSRWLPVRPVGSSEHGPQSERMPLTAPQFAIAALAGLGAPAAQSPTRADRPELLSEFLGRHTHDQDSKVIAIGDAGESHVAMQDSSARDYSVAASQEREVFAAATAMGERNVAAVSAMNGHSADLPGDPHPVVQHNHGVLTPTLQPDSINSGVVARNQPLRAPIDHISQNIELAGSIAREAVLTPNTTGHTSNVYTGTGVVAIQSHPTILPAHGTVLQNQILGTPIDHISQNLVADRLIAREAVLTPNTAARTTTAYPERHVVTTTFGPTIHPANGMAHPSPQFAHSTPATIVSQMPISMSHNAHAGGYSTLASSPTSIAIQSPPNRVMFGSLGQ
jgi:beta-lactamase regulating signal transducer with metallopeptidase domain